LAEEPRILCAAREPLPGRCELLVFTGFGRRLFDFSELKANQVESSAFLPFVHPRALGRVEKRPRSGPDGGNLRRDFTAPSVVIEKGKMRQRIQQRLVLVLL